MPLAPNLQFQDYQFKSQTLQGTWRWTTRVDVSQPSPAYTVRDVMSPWGLLRDSVPIPGDIIQAMAESIVELKSAFSPSILLGPPSSITFTLDEGRGFGEATEVLVTNGGVFGSLLNVTLTSSASYLRITPANLGNLAFNEAGTFEVMADSTNLLAIESPYVADVMLQDATAVNNPQSLPVTVIVRPKAIISLSPAALLFYVTKPGTGSFPAIPSQQFVIQNTGPAGSVLSYLTQKLVGQSDWLVSFAPSTGTLVSSDTQAVTVVVQPPDSLPIGTYTETLRVSGYSENSYQDILIQLTVS